MRLSELQRKSTENPLEDAGLQIFRERLYPVLSAPASGDVPSLEEAYQMLGSDDKGLDLWYRTVQTVNPEWFSYKAHPESVKVAFSDGTEITVMDGNTPSAIMRLALLEREAQDHPLEDVSAQIFRSGFYPKMAACSAGAFPNEQEARKLPTNELNKWYAAAKQVNPHWFEALDQLSEAAKEAAQADEIKKNKRKRRK